MKILKIHTKNPNQIPDELKQALTPEGMILEFDPMEIMFFFEYDRMDVLEDEKVIESFFN